MILPKILEGLNEKAIFRLDAHFSRDITTKGEKETSIISELLSILTHKNKDHLIWVDDARCNIREYDYSTLFKIKEFIEKFDKSIKLI